MTDGKKSEGQAPPKPEGDENIKKSDATFPEDANKSGDVDNQKPEGDKPEGKKEPKTKDEPNPEDKSDDLALKLPDGSALKPEDVAAIAAFAKEKGLSTDVAQAILERQNATLAAYVENEKKLIEEETVKWVETIKADPEIGGANFNKTVELGKRLIDRFAPDGFKEDLDRSGLGNHPGFVKLMARVAKEISSDTFERGRSDTTRIKSDAEVFYSDSKKEPVTS